MNPALARKTNTALLPISVAVMDASYIFIAAWLLQHLALGVIKPFPVPNVLVLAAVEASAWGLVLKGLSSSRLRESTVQVLAALGGLAVALGVAAALNVPSPAEFPWKWLLRASFAVLICLLVWFVGAFRSVQPTSFNTAYRTFALGLAVISGSILAISFASKGASTEIAAATGGVPLVFFAAALVSLALGNREIISRETGGTGASTGRYWTPVLLGSVGLVLVLGIAGGAFNLQRLLGVIASAFGAVLIFFAAISYYLVYAAVWFFSQFLSIDLSQGGSPPKKATTTPVTGEDPFQKLRRQFEATSSVSIPADLLNLLTWLSAILVIAVIIWALVRLSRRLRLARRERVKDESEDRESFASWVLLKAQFSRLWAMLMLRFFPRKVDTTHGVAEYDALREHPEWSGTLNVRQVYARMQSMAARMGYPRAPQQTPIEYLAVLSAAMPHMSADLTAITAAYVEARYGPLPASAPTVQAATAAWKRIEAASVPAR